MVSNLDFAIIDDYLCIRMPKEIDQHKANHIREEADLLMTNEKVRNVVFDFEQTTFMDSSGIGVIIGRYRKIACFGGKVYGIHANQRITRMLNTSGLPSVIEMIM